MVGLRERGIGLRVGERRSEPPLIQFHRHFLRHEHSRDFTFWYSIIPELPCDFVVPSQEDHLVQKAVGLEVA